LVPFLKHDRQYVRIQTAAALGKIADPTAAEKLLEGLKDSSGMVRYACCHALARLGRKVVPALLRVLGKCSEASERNLIVIALGEIDAEEAWEELVRLLEAPDWSTRAYAVRALGRIDRKRAQEVATSVLSAEEHPFVRFMIDQLFR
jgi:HEAT repeat protein